jgi:hypothetical protein
VGRKKKDKSTSKNYFTEVEEVAIVKYNQTESIDEKNKIFTQEIYKPLKKLVHEICKKYQTGTGKFGMLEMETMAFSHTFEQIPKFNPSKPNKLGELPKAYSYLGTVCRHYVTNFGKKSWREKLTNDNIEDYKIDYDEIDKSRKDRYILDSYEMHNETHFDMYETLLQRIIDEIKDFIDNKTDLTINEIKIGEAIIMIFENWKNISEENDIQKLSNFFAKKKIQQIIKDMTNLETKEIKPAFEIYMSIYKNKFLEVYNELNELDDFDPMG